MIQELLLKLIMHLPTGFFDLLYIFRRRQIDGLILDNKARFLCFLDILSSKPLNPETLDANRESMEKLARSLSGPIPFVNSISNFTVPSTASGINVRCYKPSTNFPLPVLIYFHGGGYVRGSLDSHHDLCSRLATYGGFAVLSVDYRLAPEYKFPAATEDSIAVFKWVQSHGAEIGLMQDKIAIGGDSSGGCLAIVTVQEAKRQQLALPVFQLLLYPTTTAYFDSPSHQYFSKGFFLTTERMENYRDLYLNSAAERDDFRASPLLNPDLAGLPPALVITAGFDPLRDEAESYAKALSDNNIPVGVIRYDGMVHGFVSLTAALPAADKALRQAAEALNHAFST
ncbi:MAG: alpha/beta hydrolase [Sneathiella sp.]|uniref:alpha/beta hydrolase n=1 Tax=Sneathiella sp. TaxID=1964365 RepID=UPI00300112EC